MGLIIAPQRFLCLTQFYCLHNSIFLKVSHPFNQGPMKEALHLILVFRNPGKKWLFGCTTHMTSYTFVIINFFSSRNTSIFRDSTEELIVLLHNTYEFVYIYCYLFFSSRNILRDHYTPLGFMSSTSFENTAL